MKKGYLSNYFKYYAVKRLSSVEINPRMSNQHEFNGVSSFKDIFGSGQKSYPSKMIYLGEDEVENLTEDCQVTWYDARENHPKRSEYRLYYTSNILSEVANPGDLLVIAMSSEALIYIIVAKSGSTYENNLIWLFDMPDQMISEKFFKNEINSENNRQVDYAARYILALLGLDAIATEESYLDSLLASFGEKFPSTKEFSNFSRKSLGYDDEDDDKYLLDCIAHEEMLFRTLEKYLIDRRLMRNFESADEFIKYSLSIQNRRKSRAGYALENHFEYILKKKSIDFSRGKITENKSMPDFIFPSIESYHDSYFPQSSLTMLGVKSTCKDRWRQILTEAKKIPQKHLLTLEPGISENQTKEMIVNDVQLVLPRDLFSTYKKRQQNKLMSVQSFLNFVKLKQERG